MPNREVKQACCGLCCLVQKLVLLLCWSVFLLTVLVRLTPKPVPRAEPLLLFRRIIEPASKLLETKPLPCTTEQTRSKDERMRSEAERRLPSLPLTYWFKHQNDRNKYYKKQECAPFPSIYDLEFHNTYWQTLHSTEGVFHLYGAYMDVRNTSRIGPAVRLLAVHDRIDPTLTTFCQMWFEERTGPVVVKVLEYKYLWVKAWGNSRNNVLQPYLLACVLPKEVRDLVPASVSLVQRGCDRASNNLRVLYSHPEPPQRPREFAVCVKGLDFLQEDLSLRLVEWIEMMRLLGAHKIFFYELQVHPNITKVLDYYTSLGVTTVTPITLPGGQPNLPALQHMYLKKKTTHKRQMELIPYNDCLYRHMYEYRWLALLDIDEVIVPMEDRDWSSLMKRVQELYSDEWSSYYATNIYFLDKFQRPETVEPTIPLHMHMLQHVYRTVNYTKAGCHIKAFHETSRVVALHNHLALGCLGRSCRPFAMDTEDARLQHYRENCDRSMNTTRCTDSERDTTLWRWREPLIKATNQVLQALGFLPSTAYS